MVMAFMVCFCKKRIGIDRLCIDCICAGNVKSNRIKGSEESDIRYDSSIVFCMAVTVRRNIDHKTDMKIRASVDNCLGIFGNFAVEYIIGLIRCGKYGIFWTDTDASAAAYAFVMVNGSFFVCEIRCIVGADLFAAMASDTHLGNGNLKPISIA